jgi:membrane protein DedA with SNARE-associated domain
MEFIQGFWEAIRTGNLPDLGNWSYVLIALLVFLEGPSITLVAGTMAATGILRAEWVFVAAVIGNFFADQFWYWLGRLGGHRGFLFRLRWFQRRKAEIEQLESGVQEHGVKMYLMAKLSMGLLTIPTLVSAGLMSVAWWRLAGVSVLVEPIWTGFLVFAGYRLGEHITRMERGLQVAALVGGVVLLLVLLWWYRRVFARISTARKASLPTLNE